MIETLQSERMANHLYLQNDGEPFEPYRRCAWYREKQGENYWYQSGANPETAVVRHQCEQAEGKDTTPISRQTDVNRVYFDCAYCGQSFYPMTPQEWEANQIERVGKLPEGWIQE